MTVAYKFASYKLLALLVPLLCALVDNLDLYDQPWEFIEMSSKSAPYSFHCFLVKETFIRRGHLKSDSKIV